MALRMSAKPLAATAGRTTTLAPRVATLPARPVVVRFRESGRNEPIAKDKTGAQHAPYGKLEQRYVDDQLTHTVAGQYEWQMFYMMAAAFFLFFPLVPGVTEIAKAIYTGMGGQLS